MHTLVVVNPHSGRVRPRLLESLRAAADRDAGIDLRVVPPRDIESTVRTWLGSHTEGHVVAVGGDGTVNAVANGFFSKGVALAAANRLSVWPAGTGCDYARSLGAAFEPVDVLRLAWGDRLEHERLVVNMVSFGWAASVVEARAALPARLAKSVLGYALATVGRAFTRPVYGARVRADGGVVGDSLLAVFASKGRYAGGGMQFGPRGRLASGTFELTVLDGALGGGEILTKAWRLYGAGLIGSKHIRLHDGTRALEIEADTPMPFEADGEFLGRARRFRVTVVERALSARAITSLAP